MTLTELGIEDRHEQKFSTTCPKCHTMRNKPGAKSLVVYRDEDGVRFQCMWTGCVWRERQFISNRELGELSEIQYVSPEFICPVPSGTRPPAIAGPHTLYHYCNDKGELLYYKVRIDNPDGSKRFYPLALVKGGEWVTKMPPKKTLYGMEDLHKSKQVILVEGEKARDAAKTIFNHAVVLAWPGGNVNVDEALEQLKGKEVTIWPDNDDIGIQQAEEIAKKIPAQVYIVDPTSLPPKADLADEIPAETIKQLWSARTLFSELPIEGFLTHDEFNNRLSYFSDCDTFVWESMSKLKLPRSGMVIVEGRSGHMKSTLLINMLAQYINTDKSPLVFYSYEMPAERILLKLVQILTKESLSELPYENEKLFIDQIQNDKNDAYRKLQKKLGKKVFITDEFVLFDLLIQQLSKPAMTGARVFIDYLQYIPVGQSDADNRYLMIKQFSEQLQNVAHKNQLLLFVGAQLTPGTTPEQDSPREGRDIHNAAELVLRIWNRRAGEAMGVTRKSLAQLPGDAFIEVRKNRNGFPGAIYPFVIANGARLEDIKARTDI